MATLKSTLKIESTDIFPTPINFTQVNNNTVSGDFTGFNTVDVTATASTLNFLGTISATGAFVYVQAAGSNLNPVYLGPSGFVTTAGIVKLYAGDVAFFPYGDSSGAAADIQARCAAGETGTISFFVGERAS